VALLEDEDDDPERGAERDEVQDDCLQREEHRAESTHQEQERQQDDEGENERELAVDRVDEVALLGGDPAEGQPGAVPELGSDAGQDAVL
jgi:hypothetical protein